MAKLGAMDATDLDPDPLRQLQAWMAAARDAGQPLPEAMCVATSSPDAEPSARMVLLRGVDSGLVFFTDYGSPKAADIEATGRAAAVLHWMLPVQRQVRVTGAAARVAAIESDRYWATRPVGSRRSALASHQSEVVASRAELQARVDELARLPDDDPALARPDRWGGFRITPDTVELWEAGAFRLHDRIRFRRAGAGWTAERLSP